MLKRLNFDADDLGLAIVLWICSLPLLALIIAPAFGLKVAGLTAVILLAIFLALCWGTFRQRLFRGQAPNDETNKSDFYQK
jgi:Na+/melibiose symporter-like transporter